MPRSLVLLFACASGLSVANVYYAQPLLDALAADFGISHAAVGGVITITQLGSVLALLLLVPLGDLLPRRRLMLAQLVALAVALVGVCLASGTLSLMAGMLAVGMLGTAMTQGLIAYAASAAAGHERGRVVGAAQSGVVAGLLLARVFAGLVADQAGWRGVYAVSAAIMLALALLLWRALPVQVAANAAPQRAAGAAASLSASYLRLLVSLFSLLWRNRVLQVRGVIALLMFAVFGTFWSALVFLLSAPPYGYSHTTIGAFGLVGLAGALAAARAGRWADQGRAQHTSAVALTLMLLSWLPLAFAPHSLTALLIGILALDLAVQALHVTNQSLILRAGTEHSRLIGGYMLFYAIGSGAGALAATIVYATAAWSGVCLLGAGLSLTALLFWHVTKWPVRIAKVAGPI
ncbi:MFS transporter [Duganella sp. FT109W]|uniref:MFS transporter n=1 Tax=Duganella margarita TaxID=2692170 RepID=A0ABW9WNY3_9BURK|nr:MFS transporter [Duganella margarita]MYN42909.1 MFS transporter [Duganella margarita]